MDQVERLCDDIALIDKGRVVISGSVADVRSRYRSNRVSIQYIGDPTTVASIPGVTITHALHGRIEATLDDHTTSRDVLMFLTERVDVTKFEVNSPTLHDIFVHTVTGASSPSR